MTDRRRVQQRGHLRRRASIWLSTEQFRTSCGYAWNVLLLGVDGCAVAKCRLLSIFCAKELSNDRAAGGPPCLANLADRMEPEGGTQRSHVRLPHPTS